MGESGRRWVGGRLQVLTRALCREVFKCQHKVTKDIVALKKLRPDVEKNGVRAVRWSFGLG
jgi:hypothetical protein